MSGPSTTTVITLRADLEQLQRMEEYLKASGAEVMAQELHVAVGELADLRAVHPGSDWLPAPTGPGLWWVYRPGVLRPRIVTVEHAAGSDRTASELRVFDAGYSDWIEAYRGWIWMGPIFGPRVPEWVGA